MARKKEAPPKSVSAVIYARYSSSAQNDASIEQQVAICKEYAAQHSMEIKAVYADHAVSGRSDRRPEFQKMIRHAEAREFQTVIAYKSNRIARNMLNALAYEEKLSHFGVNIVYAKEEFGDSASGRFALRTMMNLNQFFSENLAEDVTRGLYDNAQQCKVNGTIPLGYRRSADGHFEIDQERAPIIREIFERIAAGEMQSSIMDDLNRRGIRTRTGGPWTKNSFHGIITNERYTGVYIYGDVRIEDGIPVIVDRDTYDKAQEMIETVKSAVKSRRRRENVDYILTGKLFCGYCREAMVGTCGTGKLGNMYYYYRCNNQAVKHTCRKKAVRKEWIEDAIVDALRQYVFQPNTIEQMANLVMEYKKRAEASSDAANLEASLRETVSAKNNVMKAIEAGIITPTTKERLETLEADEERLHREIAEAKASIPNITREHVIFYFEQFRTGNADDPKYRKMLVRNFLRAAYLYDDHLTLTFDFSDDESDVEIPIEAESDTSETTKGVLIQSDVVYHNVLIRTPARLKMVGRVFLFTIWFDE